tara:strand:+ start:1253 stop:2260 length:1008 start_codon:yes stop_codon:yes gene_type:complete
MAQFSNTFETANLGSGVSNREDLTDVLTILAPEETPILSSANKKGASATKVEWTVDSLSAPSTAGIREGLDVTTFTDQFAGRARLGNRVQKFRRDYMVSDLQEAVDSVGPAKIAQAEAKALRELKRDIEASLASDNLQTTEDGAGVVNALGGLGDWIQNAAGSGDVPAAFRTPATSIADVTVAEGTFAESELNSLISSIFKVTGTSNNLMLVADTALRQDISDFARIGGVSGDSVRAVNYNGESGTIKLSVDLYQSDHGIVSVVNANPDCMPVQDGIAGMAGYLINPEYYGVHELIPMGSTRLPNLGGGDRGFVDCALTLGVYHPGAHGKIISAS